MTYWAYVLIVLYATFLVKADVHKLNPYQDSSKCQYARGLTVGNRTTELECCETVVRDYYTKFDLHNRYLSVFLASLQTWKCPQFKQECEQQTFNYTDFTSLLYLRFCNRSHMEATCYDGIVSIVTKQNDGTEITTSNFIQLVSKLNLITLSVEDLMNPCVQVAMYDSDSGKQGHYHEIIEPIVPFCSFVWCGFDENVFTQKNIAPWTCMSTRCRRNLVWYVVAYVFLALAIVICNATIFGVLFHEKRDVQSIYRLSLAVADFIIGIFVIPISVVTLYQHLVRSPTFTELRNVTGYEIANDSSLPMQPIVVKSKVLNELLPEQFSSSYVSAIGFFTVLSLSVSVSSLVAASFDRFVAIFRPLRYNESKAIFAAKVTVASIWFIGFVLAIFPITFPNLGSAFVASNLVAFCGKPILVVYAIAFLLAVVLMWCSMIATYIAARPSLRNHDRIRQADDEIRFVVTLGVMMAVFTLCVMPTALILIISAYLPHIDLRKSRDFDTVTAMQLTSVELSMGLVLFSNSLWNCFIYSIRETTFRSATKLLYKRIAQFLKLDHAWKLVSRKT